MVFEPDIRDLVSVDDVMEELGLGPNGGLLQCMELLMENLEWLRDALGDYDDDYILFDCPGQVELYSHVPVILHLVRWLHSLGFRVVGVYLLDVQVLLSLVLIL